MASAMPVGLLQSGPDGLLCAFFCSNLEEG